MSLKHRLAAAGTAALMAIGLMTAESAMPAFATSYNPGYICSDSGYDNCLLAHGSGNTVTVPVMGTNTTNFSWVADGSTWGEYQQVGTNLCLEWEYENPSGTVVNVVREATCENLASELWYINDIGEILNDAYPGYYGTSGCMWAPGPGEDLYVEACQSFDEGSADWFFYYDSE
jgi:hypothetical protein